MLFKALSIPDVVVAMPEVFSDHRGTFFEGHREVDLSEALGQDIVFVGSNVSISVPNTLRGLHYQMTSPQGKLVRCLHGWIFDVAVDLRRNSPTFGQWCSAVLMGRQKIDVAVDEPYSAIYVPPGFAHGFLAGKSGATVSYEVTTYYKDELNRSIRWDDPDLAIQWPDWCLPPVLSKKDAKAPLFRDAEVFA